MSKQKLVIGIFAFVIVSTCLFFAFDIVSAYNIERFTDDISAGGWGAWYRILLSAPLIIAEIGLLFDVLFFVSDKSKGKLHFLIHILASVCSVIIISISAFGYAGTVNKNLQIVWCLVLIAYPFIKGICLLMGETR